MCKLQSAFDFYLKKIVDFYLRNDKKTALFLYEVEINIELILYI
jgi:hypothetical protein